MDNELNIDHAEMFAYYQLINNVSQTGSLKKADGYLQTACNLLNLRYSRIENESQLHQEYYEDEGPEHN
jgi:hypothetical protein